MSLETLAERILCSIMKAQLIPDFVYHRHLQILYLLPHKLEFLIQFVQMELQRCPVSESAALLVALHAFLGLPGGEQEVDGYWMMPARLELHFAHNLQAGMRLGLCGWQGNRNTITCVSIAMPVLAMPL